MWAALLSGLRYHVKNVISRYTSCVPQINAFVTSLRQMRTPIVFAAPQLLTSPQSQVKELVPPRLLSARQTPSFLSRRHAQRNRSTRSKAGTRPQTTREATQQVPSVATVSNALGDTAVQFASEQLTPLP